MGISDLSETIKEALIDLKNGKMIIVVDDPGRENEGDIIQAAQFVNVHDINFITKEARGLLCVAIDTYTAKRLDLMDMVKENTSLHSTKFTVSVDAVKETSTGISAADRTITIMTIADEHSRAADLARPGHIFPIVAREGGVLRRAGHTEASVDLCRLAGLKPAAIMCEVLNEDGTMARVPNLKIFAEKHGLRIITIADLIEYRRRHEKLIYKVSEVDFPNEYGHFRLSLYEDIITRETHLALRMGEIDPESPVLVRVHSECLTGDVFGSARCDCGEQKDFAMRKIVAEGRGVLIYLRQEGRGIGLKHKIMAYELQEKGFDTVEANHQLGFKADLREYGIGAQMLADQGVQKMRLMTNNPKKLVGLKGYGLEIVERVPIDLPAKKDNARYLETKKLKMGHLITSI